MLRETTLSICSCLEHNAKQNNLQMIDTIHNAGLRISLGAFKSNPCSSIYNNAGMPSLSIRRQQNAITTVSKRATNKLKS